MKDKVEQDHRKLIADELMSYGAPAWFAKPTEAPKKEPAVDDDEEVHDEYTATCKK